MDYNPGSEPLCKITSGTTQATCKVQGAGHLPVSSWKYSSRYFSMSQSSLVEETVYHCNYKSDGNALTSRRESRDIPTSWEGGACSNPPATTDAVVALPSG